MVPLMKHHIKSWQLHIFLIFTYIVDASFLLSKLTFIIGAVLVLDGRIAQRAAAGLRANKESRRLCQPAYMPHDHLYNSPHG